MTRSHAKAAMGCDELKWYVDIDDLVIGFGGGGFREGWSPTSFGWAQNHFFVNTSSRAPSVRLNEGCGVSSGEEWFLEFVKIGWGNWCHIVASPFCWVDRRNITN